MPITYQSRESRNLSLTILLTSCCSSSHTKSISSFSLFIYWPSVTIFLFLFRPFTPIHCFFTSLALFSQFRAKDELYDKACTDHTSNYWRLVLKNDNHTVLISYGNNYILIHVICYDGIEYYEGNFSIFFHLHTYLIRKIEIYVFT